MTYCVVIRLCCASMFGFNVVVCMFLWIVLLFVMILLFRCFWLVFMIVFCLHLIVLFNSIFLYKVVGFDSYY